MSFCAHSDPSGMGWAIQLGSWDTNQTLLGLGSVGVGIFFQLSAFLLTFNLLQGKCGTFKNYIGKRFRRIYPAYLVFTLIYLLFYNALGKYDYAADLSDINFVLVCFFSYNLS